MPPGIAKTDDQDTGRFWREEVENSGNPPFGSVPDFSFTRGVNGYAAGPTARAYCAIPQAYAVRPVGFRVGAGTADVTLAIT